MTIFLRNKSNKKNGLIVSLGFVGFIILIFVVTFSVARYIPRLSILAATTLLDANTLRTENALILKSIPQSKKALAIQNQELRQKVAELQSIVADRNTLSLENQQLKEVFGRKADSDKKILARILAKPPISSYDSLLIDVGQNDGIEAGDIAYIGNVAVGQVTEVLKNTSKVALFSAPGNEITAEIGTEHLPIKIKGMGGYNFSAQVPKNSPISRGDSAALQNFRVSVLGNVYKIETKPEEPFDEIMITLPFNLNNILWVEIKTTQ